MISEVLCLFLVTLFVLCERACPLEKEQYNLEWLKFARRYPEIQLIHYDFNNAGLQYRLNESDSTHKFYNGINGNLEAAPNNFIALWVNETILDWVNNSMINNSTLPTSEHKCNQDLLYMTFNIDKMWAIQMIDAAGKPPSGILRGGTRWLGNSEECQEVVVPVETIDNIQFGGFSGHQCLIQWSLILGPKKVMQFTTGVCAPSSCSSASLKNDSDIFRQIISTIPFINVTNDMLMITNIDCSDHARSWTEGDIAYMFLLSIFLALIIVGTVCDIESKIRRKKGYIGIKNESKEIDCNQHDNAAINAIEDEITVEGCAIAVGKEEPYIDRSSLSEHIEKNTSSAKSKAGAFKEFLICFSLYTNAAKLINVENQQGQLSCLHGIRFLSMTWIILGHTLVFAVGVFDNPMDAVKLILDSFSFQAIVQGTFSVDTFFFLSGFLLAYLFLKEYGKSDKKVNWIYYYVHRLWRLSPAFFMLLGFYTTLWLHLGSGPLWPTKTENGNCEKYWWWDVLYILNFQDMSDMCMGWAWYLANDMQFYVISPLFLFFLWKMPIVGNLLVAIVMIASWITTCIISVNNNFDEMFGDGGGDETPEQFIDAQNRIGHLFDRVYIKPYCRIGPYLIGIFVGYALYKTNGHQKLVKKRLLVLGHIVGWLVALFLLAIVIFGTYHANMGNATAAAYNGLSRTAWAIGVGWIVFACLTGCGGPVNALLSWKFWVPLSRLTYCAYLVHPMVMNWYSGTLQSMLHFDLRTMVIYYFGFLVASYLAAIIASLAFESPMMALEKFILKRFSKN